MAVGIPLGPYRLIRRLATGGMAEIFLARQEGPDGFERDLVIKRILPHLAADPEFTRMFRDEAKLAARLSHPNVVHVYDFGAEADLDGVTLYLAMELVRGVDLRALILRARAANARQGIDGAIPPHHAAKITSFVCEALAHAHALRIDGAPAGIVHRDVTPSNVLVSFDGAVKLADFGIAKAATTTKERTAHGVVKGKYSYLSPEQARGEELDARSDLFNVGILLFESILGEALFPPKGTVSARKLSARGEIPGLGRFARLPEPLAKIARRALAARPEDRYQDALSLRADLEHYLRTVDEATGTVEIGEFVRANCPEEVSEDAHGPRAAGTVATRALTDRSKGSGEGSAEERGAPREPTGATVADETRVKDPGGRAPSSPLEGELTGLPTIADATVMVEDDELRERAAEPLARPPDALPGAAALALDPTPALPAQGALSRRTWWMSGTILVLGFLVAILLVRSGASPPAESLPRSAILEIHSEPEGARLFVDGTERGVTPTTLPSLTPEHALRIELRGPRGDVFDAAEVALASGERRVLRLNGLPRTGLVRVSSVPLGATVQIDGAPVGVTPLEREVPLGEHRVQLELEGFVSEDDRFLVEHAGDRASLSFALRPASPIAPPDAGPARGSSSSPSSSSSRDPGGSRDARGGSSSRAVRPSIAAGTLRVNTTPWSNVFEGSRALGQTPMQLELPAGRHTLTFRAEGRPPHREAVEIRAGEVTRLRLTL